MSQDLFPEIKHNTLSGEGWFMEGKDLPLVHSGERTNTEGKPVSSLILLSTPDSDYRSLRPHLEYVSLPNHFVLHEAGGKLELLFSRIEV